MMKLWIPLLLQFLHYGAGSHLPAPLNVSINSFNMEHTLNFLPGPGTPTGTFFRVHFLRFRRRSSWKLVSDCLKLTASQRICNLTRAMTDPLNQYQARVQAFTSTHSSNWTISGLFQPLTDTVLGPPDVSVSGCGNCLILQVSPPTTLGFKQYKQLQDLYRTLHYMVRRTRDGAQFSLNIYYKAETLISYLEPGVEYCVTVTVTTIFNPHAVPTRPYCAFTSPPANCSMCVVLGLLCVLFVLLFFIIGLAIYGSHLILPNLPRLLKTLGGEIQDAISKEHDQISTTQCQDDNATDYTLALLNPCPQ
ncbi:interferon alpha/beta receptor 2-like [Lampris incognitus]|uniref:interferon alpha/beta receptor 2-like n=1 Tax=Lampris incognitus TaxID=2546036 RepID=UPI0024B58565|nr:interferon alpha/beta receptor 2-like [Lampris incognitus]